MTCVADADVVLVDGHHPLIARAAVRHAAARDTTLVVDAGRWKPGLSDVIPHATDMVCSDDFRMPDADDPESTAAALVRSGVRTVVTTHGGDPVEWWSDGQSGSVPVEPVVVVDTRGAGDAFHGAYSYFSTQIESSLAERIDRSARVAALRCSVVGPRAWLSDSPSEQTRSENGDHRAGRAGRHTDQLVESAKALVVRRTPYSRLTGAPGAGKSTVAEQLVTALGPDAAVLVPMDGFIWPTKS